MFTLANAPNYAIKELCDRLCCFVKIGDILHFIASCEELIESNKNSLNNIHYNFKRKEDQEFVKKEWEKVYNLLELNFQEYLTKTPEYFTDFSMTLVYNKEKVDKLLKDWKEHYNLPTSVYKQLNDLSESNYADGKIFNIYAEDINGLVAGKISEVFEEYKLIKELDAYKENNKNKSIKFIYNKNKLDWFVKFAAKEISEEDKEGKADKFYNTFMYFYNLIRTNKLPKSNEGDIIELEIIDDECRNKLINLLQMSGFETVNDNSSVKLTDEGICISGKNIIVDNTCKTFNEVLDRDMNRIYKGTIESVNDDNKQNEYVVKLDNSLIDGYVFSDVGRRLYKKEIPSNLPEDMSEKEMNDAFEDIIESIDHENAEKTRSKKLEYERKYIKFIYDHNALLNLFRTNLGRNNFNNIIDYFDFPSEKEYGDVCLVSIDNIKESKFNNLVNFLKSHLEIVDQNDTRPIKFSVIIDDNNKSKKEIDAIMSESIDTEQTKPLNKELIKEFIEKEAKDYFKGAFKRKDAEFNLKNVNKEIMKQAQIKRILEEQKALSDVGVDFSRDFLNELKNMQKSDSIPGLGKDSKQSLVHDMMQQLKKAEENNKTAGKMTGLGTTNIISKEGIPSFSIATDNSTFLNSQVLQQAINISNEIKQEEKDLSMNDMLRKSSIRVASVQSTNLISNLMVSIIDRKFDSDTAKSFGIFLESEAGKSLISIIIGNLLRHVPQLKNHKNSKEFSEEFNVAGMAQLGNYVIDEHILGLLSGLTSVLDSVDKVRVEDVAHQISEEDSLDQEAQELLKTNIK